MTPQDRARKYGAFRVCYLTDDGLKIALGENDGLDELAATEYGRAACVERGLTHFWLEHQDPVTGEWNPW